MKFIIYSHRYDINSGGLIVLHFLCHLLNNLGYEAYLWPSYRPIFNNKRPIKSLGQFVKYYRKELHRSFIVNKNWNTPIAKRGQELENAIVIYPEVVDGNPLNAKDVVRWLLHKPGFHGGKINFGVKDMIIGFGEKFSTQEFPINKDNLNEFVSQLKSDLKCSDFMAIVNIAKSQFTPDDNLKLFKAYASENEKAETAYLYLLLEYEMISKAQEFLDEQGSDEFVRFRAFLELKKKNAQYKITDLMRTHQICNDA
ncbi:MAG: hypothetical protein IE878_03090 [Epsilonproteobacteria bacterium]|nr:hypothetical protein [Campylobacterota bacterium]